MQKTVRNNIFFISYFYVIQAITFLHFLHMLFSLFRILK